MTAAVAIDLGGTRLKAGLVELPGGRVVSEAEPRPSGDTWADAHAALADTFRCLSSTPDTPLALAMPGIIDRGKVVSLPGKFPGAEGYDVAAVLGELTGGRTLVVNDAVAAGAGEALAGAGAGHDRVVVVTLGTGVGVSVVDRGRPLGTGPFGGGIVGGQVPIGDDHLVPDAVRDLVDTAGRTGTIEARCRTVALVERARLAGADFSSAEEVVAAARAGDTAAVAALDDHRSDLGRAVAALTHAHAPTCVVVAGGLASEPLLFDGLAAAVNGRLSFGLQVVVRPAALGSAAALAGAALLLEASA